ncbi:hypothetical protein FH972_022769 [Carpinus fangiana]|uniref:PH domain-containing protein n=1 Tax=Carpinus fangiana TaxID=176857 RepID=A0A5N6KTL3_9ROSI|nr:hypothetical protein FH972_022769 [Carpinus fangiana]
MLDTLRGPSKPLQMPMDQTSPIPLRLEPPRSQPRPSSAFSPVSEQGCFEFDKTLKSGQLLKRTKMTKSWKPVHLVLRQNVLSVYKDEHETQLRHQISLSDINAIAMRRDRNRKGDHEGVFGLYMPYRTFHFEAATKSEAEDWVTLIRREAHIDEDGEHIAVQGTSKTDRDPVAPQRVGRSPLSTVRTSSDRGSSSSPDPAYRARPAVRPGGSQPIPIRQGSATYDYSGGEHGSYSDFSDAPGFGSARDFSPMSARRPESALGATSPYEHKGVAQGGSSTSGFDVSKDEARTILHGYLLCLKTRSGMRQWKKYWVVLRPKHLALYKNEEEYSAILILPTTSIVDAVDIDPVSKSKVFCMQIILEDRSYRFCASDDDELSKWLGGIKSVLARQKGPSSKGAAPTNV